MLNLASIAFWSFGVLVVIVYIFLKLNHMADA
jgi:hypothetical protein